jgi:selenide, water dikinase
MSKLPPIQLDLVLIGGGHAHVHLLKMLGMPEYRKWVMTHGVQVTLIARDLHTPYSGMLPGFVAGHYTYDEIHLDLVKLCRFSKTRLVHAAAQKITYNDATRGGMIECHDGRPPIRFDALSIDVGITPSTEGMTPSTLDSIIPVKPIANFCQYYETLRTSLVTKYQNVMVQPNTPKHIVAVIGGGAGGIELALSMQYSFQSVGLGRIIEVIVVTRGSTLLDSHNNKVQKIFHRILNERNVKVHYQAEVVAVEEVPDNGKQKKLVLSEKTRDTYEDNPILVNDVLWCTKASAASWLSDATPFRTSIKGNFIQVNSYYESVSHKGVFACGDCCDMVENPRPKGT